jgi:hypothetical protein
MSVLTQAFWLVVLHFLCDFHLQSDFIARGKQPGSGAKWPWVMTAHAAVQGGAVAVILGPAAGLAETAAHWLIDYGKSKGWLGKGEGSFVIDQVIHLGCKALWIAIFPSAFPAAGFFS